MYCHHYLNTQCHPVLEPILRKGGRDLQVLVDGVQDGIAPTAEFIRETEELSGRVDVLSESAQVLKNGLLSDLVPAFMEAADWSARFLNNFFGITKGPFISDMRVVADVLRGVGTGAGDAGGAIEDMSAKLILSNVAALIVKGNNQAALAMYDVYLEAQKAEDKIQAVIDGLLALNGTSATAYINLVTSGGAPGGGQAIPMPDISPNGAWKPFSSNDPGLAGYTQRKYYNGHWIYQAQGGEIGTGGEFVVGEHGAERFSPSTPGTISPNHDSLAQAINRMVRTLPTVITDAIERSK